MFQYADDLEWNRDGWLESTKDSTFEQIDQNSNTILTPPTSPGTTQPDLGIQPSGSTVFQPSLISYPPMDEVYHGIPPNGGTTIKAFLENELQASPSRFNALLAAVSTSFNNSRRRKATYKLTTLPTAPRPQERSAGCFN